MTVILLTATMALALLFMLYALVQFHLDARTPHSLVPSMRTETKARSGNAHEADWKMTARHRFND
jgi:hypothetical protein